MAVPRPVLLAVLGAVLAAALFFATMGAREPTDEAAPPPPASENAPGKATAAKSRSAPKAEAAGTGDRATAAAASRARAERPRVAAPVGVPAAVTRALARKRTVVLFFYQRGSADDDATASAVASVRGRPGVSVFSAPISRLADFRGVTAGAGVSQAPAVVILGRQGRARLIEGFVDGETLAQEVTDSR